MPNGIGAYGDNSNQESAMQVGSQWQDNSGGAMGGVVGDAMEGAMEGAMGGFDQSYD